MRVTIDFDLIPEGLRMEHLLIESDGATIFVEPVSTTSVRCPVCVGSSGRVMAGNLVPAPIFPGTGLP